jgi:CHAT domain-containing protein/Flp pilus assembly protein TadD
MVLRRHIFERLFFTTSLFVLGATLLPATAQAGPREDCMGFYRQGIQFENQHNFGKAAEALGRAATICETVLGPNAVELSDIYNSRGHTDYNLGHYSDAVTNLQRVLAIREQALPPTDPKVAGAMNDLAFLEDNLGRYDEAEALDKRAFAISQKFRGPDHPDTIRVLNNLALVYLHAARYADAEPLLKRVTTSWEKSLGPTHPDVATSTNNLAGLYDLTGRYAAAEQLDKHVLEIFEKVRGLDSPDVARSLNNLARLYGEEGRYADAEPLSRRALVIGEKAHGPDHPEIVGSLITLAADDMAQGHYADAEPLLKRALAIREKAFGPDNTLVAQIINNVAGLYVEQKRFADAEPLFKRAVAINLKALGPEHPELAKNLNNLGFVDTQQGRYADAEPLLMQALAIEQKTLGPDHPDVANTLNGLAAVYDAEGRNTDALTVSRKATEILIRRSEQGGDDRADSGEQERQNDRGYFLRLLHLLWNQFSAGGSADSPTIDDAFTAAQFAGGIETAKAVSGTMARAASGNDDLAALVREREDLGSRWHKIDSDLLKAVSLAPDKRNASAEAGLRKERADIDAKLTADNEKLRVSFPRFAELAEARPVHLADIQAVLGANEAFAAFTLAEKESFLFVIRKDDAHFFKLNITRAEAADIVKTLRGPMSNDQPVDITKAYQLYQSLLGPADALISGTKNLIVAPDGALQSLPFAVLVTKPPAAAIAKPADYQAVAWLIRRQAITVVPAASSLVALRRFAAEKHGTDPFVGFGDPIFDGSGATRGIDTASLYRGAEASEADLRRLPRLPETADELRAEAKALGAPDSSLHLGQNANITGLRQLDLSQTRVLSFATHGLVAGDLPKLGEPALVLTPPAHSTPEDDGLLRASEVSKLKLDADFVILSACNTAASDGAPGAEGLSGLAKAFFYAGARSLLVSHWPVDSQATVKLTTGLIKANAINPSIGRAEALRTATLAMIDETGNGAEHAHPFFWAPFILAGEGGSGR